MAKITQFKYEEAVSNGWLEVKDFSKYDFGHPVMSTETMTVDDVNKVIYESYKGYYTRPIWLLRHPFSRNDFRRQITRYFLHLVATRSYIYSGGKPLVDKKLP